MSPWIKPMPLAAVLSLAACNVTPGSPADSSVSQAPPTVSAGDQAFLTRAVSHTIYEVKSAALALDRASDPQTQRFAVMLAETHNAIGHQLDAFAAANRVPIPTDMDGAERRSYATLERAPTQFERAFFDQQARAERRALDLYRDEAANGRNPDLRRFADAALPVLRQESQLADQAACPKPGSPCTADVGQ